MNVQGEIKLEAFLNKVLPERIPTTAQFEHLNTRKAFIHDVIEAIATAPSKYNAFVFLGDSNTSFLLLLTLQTLRY